MDRTLEHKIKQILLHGCFHAVGLGKYICRPIAGYNSSTYELDISTGYTTCNCQGFRKKKECSHAEALRRYLAGSDKQLKLL